MGTLTGDIPQLLEHCLHKLPTSCRLTSTPSCCACADDRPHSTSYSVYVDGVGMTQRGTRWQNYCWYCKTFWDIRVAAAQCSARASKIPEHPDITTYLEFWYDFHQGYRIIQRDGRDEIIHLVCEPWRNVDPGHLPRTLDELRNERSSRLEEIATMSSMQSTTQTSQPEVAQQSLEETLDQMLAAIQEEEEEGVDGGGDGDGEPVPSTVTTSARRDRPNATFIFLNAHNFSTLQETLPQAVVSTMAASFMPGNSNVPPIFGVCYDPSDHTLACSSAAAIILLRNPQNMSLIVRENPPIRVSRPYFAEFILMHVGLTQHTVVYGDRWVISNYVDEATDLATGGTDADATADPVEPQQSQLGGNLVNPPPERAAIVVPAQDVNSTQASDVIPQTDRYSVRTAIEFVNQLSLADRRELGAMAAEIVVDFIDQHNLFGRSLNFVPTLRNYGAGQMRSIASLVTERHESSIWYRNSLQDHMNQHDIHMDLAPIAVEVPQGRPRRSGALDIATLTGASVPFGGRVEMPFSVQATLDSSDRPTALPDEQLLVNLECKVCYGQVADILCLPCAHLCMCRWCADVVIPHHPRDVSRPRDLHAECPVCRRRVHQRVRIYL